MNSSKVLVVITTYNRIYYLEQAIQSVLSQSYKDIEILISDNSTNEDSREMIEKNFKELLLKLPRMIIIHFLMEDQGLTLEMLMSIIYLNLQTCD